MERPMKHRRAAFGTALALCLASGGLAGCTGGDDRPSAAGPSGSVIVPGRPGEPNKTVPATKGTVTPPGAADIRFVQMMVPHHEQALEMAALAPGQAANAKVKALADRIDAAQTAEISAMQSWLRQHARQAQGGHHGGGHGSDPAAPMQMPGMATPQQMAQLKAATGTNFDRLFLTLMITHHQGALTMAKEEFAKGTDVLIREMAQEVFVTQTAEINRMRALLGP
jgi:uncharacterized protein (DUF305 family)